jgi:mono/diheme cytochrome c family protein
VDGKESFGRNCAACHGERGDGKGLAEVFLFPKPRDLRAGRFRLVSTDNNVPTRDDLLAVIGRGMPGSAMPGWQHLPAEERNALVDEVLRLRKEGARELFIGLLKEQELTEEEIKSEENQAEIEGYAQEATTPGNATAVPEFAAATAEQIAHGKEVYVRQACDKCHGAQGKGDGQQVMIDEELLPTSPRDFTLGIFKGGHDASSLYRRVAYGMPGTPMPSSPQLSPEDTVDLVYFILSLSSPDDREKVILRRQSLTARKVDSMPGAAESQWGAFPVTKLGTMPLVWRTDAIEEVAVQAVHDGSELAVRLSWADSTKNGAPRATDEFEDMAAIQFFKGPNEPFLGMGAAAGEVDVWLWKAGWSEKVETTSLLDDYPFDTAVYAGLNGGAPTADPSPDFLTSRAAGNPNANVDRSASAANLAARGPGSLSFQPRGWQQVTASAKWADGRWSVVLRRPLTAAEAEGVSFAAGEKIAAAFAVWDGQKHERDGRKVITVWHDLILE